MKRPQRYTVTAALPYANGPVHIGHLAGCYLPSDIYVRFLRLKGEDVLYVCGSDEHGVAITLKAKQEIKIEAGTDLKAKSGTNTEIKAKAQFKAEGSAGADFRTSAIATIQGSLVKIN